ncbi:MAG: tripartite tricarboxylate transporter substrate binding protein [Burkholderiales bacterium]|nr:tripartite tricarboxylate transporter substrate binding protein [Burkholderiales bacterium]
MTRITHQGSGIALLLLGPCAAAGAAAPDHFPSRPIRFVTAAVGGGNDFSARIIAQGLAVNLGQQVIVDNRGGSHIPQLTVSKATPDGYTILVQNNTVWVAPLLEKVAYDHFRELVPITLTARTPNILAAHPSLPATSVKDLIAAAKAAPGEINYASGVVGSSNFIAAELFKAMAGVNLTRIGYKGSGPALIDVMAGQVKLIFSTTTSTWIHVKSGKLKALAITSAEPSPLAPGLPTIAASGVPGYSAEAIYAVWAPARTPRPILALLNREIVKVLTAPQVRERFFGAGAEVVASTPQALAAEIRSETERLDRVFRNAGIRVNR